ncbi:MAG TPA: hypothetical protein ENI77_05195 [Nitrospirae bacterium]|nr:hypothetical protein [Nitrospirota bacterium]
MNNSTKYFGKARLKNIILNESACKLIKFPTGDSEGAYRTSLITDVHYAHKLVPKKVDQFSTTIDVEQIGYETLVTENVKQAIEIYRIKCKISGYFVLAGGKEDIKTLRKYSNVFAAQIFPYLKEHMDYLLSKMDLIRRGVRFPFVEFDYDVKPPKKKASKKKTG